MFESKTYLLEGKFNRSGKGWVALPRVCQQRVSDLYDAAEIMRDRDLACSIHSVRNGYSVFVPEIYIPAWEESIKRYKKRIPKSGARFKKIINNMVCIINETH